MVVGFAPGIPRRPRNKTFGAIAGRGGWPTATRARLFSAIGPDSGDVVVTKRRVSAFTGSDLEVVLRAGEVDSLVLTGIATSGVVLSTLRQAADLDYRLTVLADGCLDADPEVHRVLTEKLFPRQADVLAIADWTASLARPAAG